MHRPGADRLGTPGSQRRMSGKSSATPVRPGDKGATSVELDAAAGRHAPDEDPPVASYRRLCCCWGRRRIGEGDLAARLYGVLSSFESAICGPFPRFHTVACRGGHPCWLTWRTNVADGSYRPAPGTTFLCSDVSRGAARKMPARCAQGADSACVSPDVATGRLVAIAVSPSLRVARRARPVCPGPGSGACRAWNALRQVFPCRLSPRSSAAAPSACLVCAGGSGFPAGSGCAATR